MITALEPEKSEAIARARRCRSSQWDHRVVYKKRIVGENGGPRRHKWSLTQK
jgi:hypothetical protein